MFYKRNNFVSFCFSTCIFHCRFLSIFFVLLAQFNSRRRSRINTDRFPKRAPKAQAFSGVRGLAPKRNYLDFYSLESPFLGFRVIQMEYRPDFNLESIFIFKNIFNMKNVTYFRKTVETGVDPHLNSFY